MIRKSSIRRLSELKVNRKIALILESVGFKYIKSKSEFRRNIGNYVNVFSIQIPFEAIRFDKAENNFILWFELYSYIGIPKFDKWFKKNTKNEVRVYTKLNEFNGFIKLESIDLHEDDFFIPNESKEYKHAMFNNLIGERPSITDNKFFNFDDTGKDLLFQESIRIKSLSNLESFLKLEKNIVFNRYHVSFLDINPYFLSYVGENELAKQLFENSYQKYISIFPNLNIDFKYEEDYFFEFFESFIQDAKKLVGLEYLNNLGELKKRIKSSRAGTTK